MKQQPPTVFVALMLAPNQADLFDEIEAEATDILSSRAATHEARHVEGNDLVLLDRDNVRLGLGWAKLPSGDALTLAIGAPPERYAWRQRLARRGCVIARGGAMRRSII